MEPRRDSPLIWLGKYLSLALTLPASVAGGYLLGAFLDRWLKTSIFVVIGILLGVAGGLVQIIRELNRDAKRQ